MHCPQAYTCLNNPLLRLAYQMTSRIIQNAPFIRRFAEHVRGTRKRIKAYRDLDLKIIDICLPVIRI